MCMDLYWFRNQSDFFMNKTPFVGRIEEKRMLENALQSSKAEMISVIGRRRIGKTFLLKSVYQETIDFEITGIHNTVSAW